MFDLTGRSALVTGASGGIGSGIARALHAQGATVALSGTRRDALEALAASLGERTHALPCDLSDKDSVEALVPAAEAAMGGLDILVANAGITRDNLFVQLKDDEWDQVLNINLTGTFRLARAAVRGMMRRRFGRVIAITSVVGVTGNPGQGNYVAAKAGLIGMMKSVAQEYARRGITANSVAPGFIQSPMTDRLNDKQRDAILTRVPTARLGTADDVAAAVVYLASDEAAYVTGQTLHVNGGMTMV
ncbi:MAG: 3-oxoacyl-[acyl-carrier-protein] reductase [Rhizobiales bacterium]|nr:3-oxoacyl-[acyl-carrier-protein] reductase [Hyphomicrobiales bacterium]